ncbi:MAG: protoheme IX farnesyltransferase [Methanomassiliicoccales archaeon]|nr:MAG: protoheme IX farnesyltransferase [Methanomassiliicoccales archaeon]
MARIADYASLGKIRTVFLLTFCAATAFIIAGGLLGSLAFLILIIATALGVAGAAMIHNYLDRDIDQIMERTKKRPLPAEKIQPVSAAFVGMILLGVGLSLAFYLSVLTFAFALLAAVDYLLVYTWMSKRKNPLNIILASPAGGLPVLAGWSAATGSINLLSILLAILVITWIPNHIWNLAIIWSDDYKKAKIPMLPVVVDMKRACRCTIATVVILFALTTYLFVGGYFGYLYLAITLPFSLALMIGNLWVYRRPSKKAVYGMFKFSSPYLAVVFLAMVLDLALA